MGWTRALRLATQSPDYGRRTELPLAHLSLFLGTGASGLNPYDMTVFGANVLFGGTNANGKVGLWETDGTAGGTHEVTGISGADALVGLNPQFLTALGGEAVFSGRDTGGNTGLWVTDGTGPDTTELTGIKDINGDVVTDLTPRFLTGFNGEVLFNGRDSDSNGL